MATQNADGDYYYSDDDLQVDSMASDCASHERDFWLYYYGRLTAFSDPRKFLLEKYEVALLMMKDDGTINFNAVDPNRINSNGDGYTKALKYIIQDIRELADTQNLTQHELERLTSLAKNVLKHRKRHRSTDRGHVYVLEQWSAIVEAMKHVEP